jgi:hypothetical protein
MPAERSFFIGDIDDLRSEEGTVAIEQNPETVRETVRAKYAERARRVAAPTAERRAEADAEDEQIQDRLDHRRQDALPIAPPAQQVAVPDDVHAARVGHQPRPSARGHGRELDGLGLAARRRGGQCHSTTGAGRHDGMSAALVGSTVGASVVGVGCRTHRLRPVHSRPR